MAVPAQIISEVVVKVPLVQNPMTSTTFDVRVADVVRLVQHFHDELDVVGQIGGRRVQDPARLEPAAGRAVIEHERRDTTVRGRRVDSHLEADLLAIARMSRDTTVPLPRWNFAAADVDVSTTPYSYTDGAFNSSTGVTHDMNIPSGIS